MKALYSHGVHRRFRNKAKLAEMIVSKDTDNRNNLDTTVKEKDGNNDFERWWNGTPLDPSTLLQKYDGDQQPTVDTPGDSGKKKRSKRKSKEKKENGSNFFEALMAKVGLGELNDWWQNMFNA